MPQDYPEIFDKADWLKGEKKFEAEYYNLEKNIFIEAPLHPNLSIASDIADHYLNILMGKYSYSYSSGIISPNVIIGRYCSIAHYVSIGATHHHMEYLSTGGINIASNYYGAYTEQEEPKDVEYTIVGCDVWIGVNALILGGTKIGHGACIGAGSVVTKEIPPYAIAVGNPARVIKSRFSDEIIADLLDLKWWNLETDQLNQLPYKNIKECIEVLKDIRKNK